MRVRSKVLQVTGLAGGPVRHVVHGAFHARVIVPQETHYARLGPDVALENSKSYQVLWANLPTRAKNSEHLHSVKISQTDLDCQK